MATQDELLDETRRARKVRHIVDISASLIMQGNLSRQDAEWLERVAREQILNLFPGADETYEIIYAHRFRRLIDEFTPARPADPGVILPSVAAAD